MNATYITITGNLAEDPELRFTPTGKATARLRVAVNTRYQNNTGAWVDRTTSWHTVITWGAMAENVAESVTKGQRVVVTGRLEQREYSNETGDKRTVWEVTAEDIGLSLRHTSARTLDKAQTAAE
ncbi:MAG: single-stranded DNA-binding protein [Sporichthyaceae bacterium]